MQYLTPGGWHRPDMETNCIGVCELDKTTRQCKGCFRYVDEIAGWRRLTDRQREDIMKRCWNEKKEYLEFFGDSYEDRR